MDSLPVLNHVTLQTTFRGLVHPMSSQDAQIHQYRGIKYASVPARFRQSKLYTSYPMITDATRYGYVPLLISSLVCLTTSSPICPQVKGTKSIEETLLSLADVDIPKQALKHNEFECLNLNITCPAGLTPQARLPVMVWVHG